MYNWKLHYTMNICMHKSNLSKTSKRIMLLNWLSYGYYKYLHNLSLEMPDSQSTCRRGRLTLGFTIANSHGSICGYYHAPRAIRRLIQCIWCMASSWVWQCQPQCYQVHSNYTCGLIMTNHDQKMRHNSYQHYVWT